ncbi:MAG: hypothetical protein H0U66_06160 [Gemmatimonadaceae bacterium]|nr:hypothetical protein [Gemmatimonadaceae bacterium]
MADSTQGERGGDPGAVRCDYERLREAVLSGCPDGFRLGHGVLVTHGTVAWIAAVTEAVAVVPPGTEVAEPVPVPSASSLPAAGEIVAVLAQMALAIAA